MAVRTGAGVHLNLPPAPGRRQAGAPAGDRPTILRFNQPGRHPGDSPNATAKTHRLLPPEPEQRSRIKCAGERAVPASKRGQTCSGVEMPALWARTITSARD